MTENASLMPHAHCPHALKQCQAQFDECQVQIRMVVISIMFMIRMMMIVKKWG